MSRTLMRSAALAVLLWLGLVVVIASAKAAPAADAAAPLDYTARETTRALDDWALAVIDTTALDGVSFDLKVRKCDRPAAARYRCVIAGDYIDDDGGRDGIVVRLTRCRPSRHVGVQSLSSTRARVVVRWRGERAGGLICKARFYGERR